MVSSYNWKERREKKALLVLEDGSVFRGYSFGAKIDVVGEVVFNTGMSGYQEVITDPSYAGQFVTMTYPEIGNTGINFEDNESRSLFLNGLIINELNEASNWRSKVSLKELLESNKIPAIAGIDTRALTTILRNKGTMKAFLHCSNTPLSQEECLQKARSWSGLDGQDYAAKVTCAEPYEWDDRFQASGVAKAMSDKTGYGQQVTEGNREHLLCVVNDYSAIKVPCHHLSSLNGNLVDPTAETELVPSSNDVQLQTTYRKLQTGSCLPPADLKVVAYDFGIKWNILRLLRLNGMSVIVVPAQTSVEEVMKYSPDGVFFSNGPADPAAVGYAVKAAKELIGKVPIMGICLGHQLLSLACGAKTYRLKFGHHGCNHPVKNLGSGRIEITSQNHNFAVAADSISSTQLEPTHINLNDNTVEGVKHRTEPLIAIQYHPEAAPGPHDPNYLLRRFRELIIKS